jgi:hypothetical protein
METAKLVRVYETRVWIESDLLGRKHVMVQSDAPGSKPFQYATFFYDYAYTSNAGMRAAAWAVAESIGGVPPFEERSRGLPNKD